MFSDAMPDNKMGDMSLNQLIEAATAVSHIPINTHGKYYAGSSSFTSVVAIFHDCTNPKNFNILKTRQCIEIIKFRITNKTFSIQKLSQKRSLNSST